MAFMCFIHKLRWGKKPKALQVAEVINLRLLSRVACVQVSTCAIVVRYINYM